MPKSTCILEVRWCIHNYNQVIGYKTCNHKVPYKPTSLDRSNTKKKKCWVFLCLSIHTLCENVSSYLYFRL